MNKTPKLHENMFKKEKCFFYKTNTQLHDQNTQTTQLHDQNTHSTLKYVQKKIIHNLKTVSFQIYFASLYMLNVTI